MTKFNQIFLLLRCLLDQNSYEQFNTADSVWKSANLKEGEYSIEYIDLPCCHCCKVTIWLRRACNQRCFAWGKFAWCAVILKTFSLESWHSFVFVPDKQSQLDIYYLNQNYFWQGKTFLFTFRFQQITAYWSDPISALCSGWTTLSPLPTACKQWTLITCPLPRVSWSTLADSCTVCMSVLMGLTTG